MIDIALDVGNIDDRELKVQADGGDKLCAEVSFDVRENACDLLNSGNLVSDGESNKQESRLAPSDLLLGDKVQEAPLGLYYDDKTIFDDSEGVLDGFGIREMPTGLLSSSDRGIGRYVSSVLSLFSIDPLQPTNAKPGSPKKVMVLSARYAAGLSLWHEGDNVDQSDYSDSECQEENCM